MGDSGNVLMGDTFVINKSGLNEQSNRSAGDEDASEMASEFFVLDPVVYLIFSVLTVCGSSLIFWLFATTKKLRSITGYLMLFITIIDSCTTLFILMPSVYTTIALQVPWEGTPLCSLQAYSNMFLQNFKANLVMLCALDRAYSLLRPFAYQRIVSKKVLFACLAMITLFSFTMPVYLWGYYGWPGSSAGSPMCWPTVVDERAKFVYWTSIVLDLICPGIIVVICYGLIVVIVIKQRKAINEQRQMSISVTNYVTDSKPSQKRQSMGNSDSKQRQSSTDPESGKISLTLNALREHNLTNAGLDWIQHLAACKMLFLVTLLYFLAHVPIFVADHFFQSNAVLMTVCNYLAYLSTWMNFIIYFNTDSFFKAATKTFFRSFAQKKLNLESKYDVTAVSAM